MSITKQALDDALDYYVPHWRAAKMFTPAAMNAACVEAFTRGDNATSNPHAQTLYIAMTELHMYGHLTYESITYEKG